jgi:hypothetical protein
MQNVRKFFPSCFARHVRPVTNETDDRKQRKGLRVSLQSRFGRSRPNLYFQELKNAAFVFGHPPRVLNLNMELSSRESGQDG